MNNFYKQAAITGGLAVATIGSCLIRPVLFKHHHKKKISKHFIKKLRKGEYDVSKLLEKYSGKYKIDKDFVAAVRGGEIALSEYEIEIISQLSTTEALNSTMNTLGISVEVPQQQPAPQTQHQQQVQQPYTAQQQAAQNQFAQQQYTSQQVQQPYTTMQQQANQFSQQMQQ